MDQLHVEKQKRTTIYSVKEKGIKRHPTIFDSRILIYGEAKYLGIGAKRSF